MTADPESSKLLALASAIAKGETVEWDAERRQLDPDEDGVLGALEALERIAGAHRRIHDSPPVDFSHWAHLTLSSHAGDAAGTLRASALDGPGRKVALVLIGPMRGSVAEIEPLLKEARLRTTVHHPHLAAVHGADYAQDYVGMWSEELPGPTLEEIVRARGPVESAEAVRIVRDLCGAVGTLHHAGLVHGDIRPALVARAEDGRVVLAPSLPGRAGPAPTQASDLAALGSLLRHLLGPHPLPALTRVCDRAITPDPAERFSSTADLDAALQAAMTPRRIGREWLIGFAIGLAIVAGILLLMSVAAGRFR